ncbi:MAG: hypothetical protein VXZ18_08330 [Pseudomonadota bacterium]|nr:hypothetical protein [Pseudomonadota bacterium]
MGRYHEIELASQVMFHAMIMYLARVPDDVDMLYLIDLVIWD